MVDLRSTCTGADLCEQSTARPCTVLCQTERLVTIGFRRLQEGLERYTGSTIDSPEAD